MYLRVTLCFHFPANTTKCVVIQETLLNLAFTDMKLGRNVARTFLDYYKLNNLIDDSKLTGHIHRCIFQHLLKEITSK